MSNMQPTPYSSSEVQHEVLLANCEALEKWVVPAASAARDVFGRRTLWRLLMDAGREFGAYFIPVEGMPFTSAFFTVNAAVPAHLDGSVG
jgi:hypothetical protein